MSRSLVSRRSAVFIAVVLVGASAAAAPRGAVAAACDPTWAVVPTPNVSDTNSSLSQLAVVSPTDIWAVGNAGDLDNRRTLIQHSNGTAWNIVPSPNTTKPINWLIDVSATASNDVWAVGYAADSQQSSSRNITLIEHYNGTSWTIVPSPNPQPNLGGGYPVSNELFSVVAISPTNVFAVGWSYNLVAGQTFMLRWNGSVWQNVSVPHPGRYSALRAIDAVSASDIWAVGEFDNNGNQQTLTLHWNGSTWTRVPSPNDGPYLQYMFSVEALSSNDVWVVGYHLAVFGFTEPYQTSAFHWNGTSWQVVPSPDVNQQNNYLFSVSGTGGSDVWAVGFWDTGTALRTLTEHWNGTSWSVVQSPNAHSTIDELLGVAAISPSNVWAVGESFDDVFNFTSLAEHLTACSGPQLHVASIIPRFIASTNRVRAAITVVDAAAAPASGATVTVDVGLPNGTHVVRSGTTDATGRAFVAVMRSQAGRYAFTVTNVMLAGASYVPAANVETTDSISVP
jgi:hypothetical protein